MPQPVAVRGVVIPPGPVDYRSVSESGHDSDVAVQSLPPRVEQDFPHIIFTLAIATESQIQSH
jgi:hypothetical protein